MFMPHVPSFQPTKLYKILALAAVRTARCPAIAAPGPQDHSQSKTIKLLIQMDSTLNELQISSKFRKFLFLLLAKLFNVWDIAQYPRSCFAKIPRFQQSHAKDKTRRLHLGRPKQASKLLQTFLRKPWSDSFSWRFAGGWRKSCSKPRKQSQLIFFGEQLWQMFFFVCFHGFVHFLSILFMVSSCFFHVSSMFLPCFFREMIMNQMVRHPSLGSPRRKRSAAGRSLNAVAWTSGSAVGLSWLRKIAVFWDVKSQMVEICWAFWQMIVIKWAQYSSINDGCLLRSVEPVEIKIIPHEIAQDRHVQPWMKPASWPWGQWFQRAHRTWIVIKFSTWVDEKHTNITFWYYLNTQCVDIMFSTTMAVESHFILVNRKIIVDWIVPFPLPGLLKFK